MRRVALPVLSAALALLLVACGGGSSSADAGGTTGGGTTGGGTSGGATSAPSSMAKSAGDLQTAAPATAVSTAPEVVVLDASGAPVPGVVVTFAAPTGSGSVEHTQVNTDADGHASPGNWTLGSTAGLDSLTATVSGLDPVVFTATAAHTSPDVKVSTSKPASGALVGDQLSVTASIASTYQITTVTATYAGQSVSLTFGASGWSGTLSLAGEPGGSGAVVITATDAFGHVTDVVVPVTLDRPPSLTVSSPIDGTVAQPTINIVAGCTDDNPAGCSVLGASINGKHVADGTTSLSQTVDLSSYEGQTISLLISGFDSANQRVNVTRTIYVETSSHLVAQTMVTGPIVDVSGTRILYIDASGSTPVLKILDTSTKQTQILETSADLIGTGLYGYLTASGAIYAHGNLASIEPFASLYEWRNGALTMLSGSSTVEDLHVAGSWAIYFLEEPQQLWSRDLGQGISTLVSTTAGNNSNDVAANGDIAYWGITPGTSAGTFAYNVYRVRSGTTEALTNDQPPITDFYPLTDGANVVFLKETGTSSTSLVLDNGTSQSSLTTDADRPQPGSGYAISNGFVAYLQADTSDTEQIWLHSPTGEQQLTFFGSSSKIDALGGDGTVVLDEDTRRYIAVPGAQPEDIGSLLGSVIYRDGKFYVLIDRTVLLVTP